MVVEVLETQSAKRIRRLRNVPVLFTYLTHSTRVYYLAVTFRPHQAQLINQSPAKVYAAHFECGFVARRSLDTCQKRRWSVRDRKGALGGPAILHRPLRLNHPTWLQLPPNSPQQVIVTLSLAV
jgi:hypothetical protein